MAATLGTITIPAAAATPGAVAQPTSAIHYVALGDSRAAGPTWSSFLTGDGCGRTTASYPNIVAAALKPASFTDVACSGATTDSVLTVPQPVFTPLPHHVPVQIDALRPDTNLVTLSIGGNDIAWGTLIAPCFGKIAGADEHCRDNPAVAQSITNKFVRLTPAIDNVLIAIGQRSPHARVVVVGHGGYFGSEGCFPDADADGADAQFVLDFFARFNAILRDAATAHGDTFVDIAGPAVGHDACRSADVRWFTGAHTAGPIPFFHPTPLGSAEMGRLVLAAIDPMTARLRV